MVTIVTSRFSSLSLLCNFIFLIIVVSVSGVLEPRRLPAFSARGIRKPGPDQTSERIVIHVLNTGKNSRRVGPAVAPNSPITHLKVRPVQISRDRPLQDVEQFYDFLLQMGLNKMCSFLRKAQLDSVLKNSGPLTLFGPTDEAFALLPGSTLEEISNDRQKLRDFLLYHIVKGHVMPANVRNDFTTPSVESSPLRFNIYNKGQMISVSGAQFLDSSQKMNNILVQPVDRVLYPISRNNLVEKTRLNYDKMHGFLVKSGLTHQLASGTFTLFAPTDDAFSSLPEKAREMLLTNSTLLRKVILNHVVPGTYFSTVLANGYNLKSLGGEPLNFTSRRGLILVNGIPIIKPDITVTNGVIHALNRVLVPPEVADMCRCMPKHPGSPATLPTPHPTDSEVTEGISFGTRIKKPTSPADESLQTEITDATDFPLLETSSVLPTEETTIAEDYYSSTSEPRKSILEILEGPLVLDDGNNATFSTANSLLKKSLLINRLRQRGSSFTLLLPTDDAFRRLPPGTVGKMERNGNLLRQVMRCHVVNTSLAPVGLRNNFQVNTLGGPLVVNVLNGGKTILVGGGRVLAVRPASNGIVYVTNRVNYPPPSSNIPRGLQNRGAGNTSTWLRMIVGAGMQNRLSGPGVYTMFVPSDAAFSRFPPRVMERLMADKNLLQELVSTHVVEGAYFRRMLTSGLVLPSLNGEKLRFNVIPGGFLVNEAPVSKPGIVTGNGVIYVIDSVLYRPLGYRDLLGPTEGGLQQDGSPDKSLDDIAKENSATTFLRWLDTSKLRSILQTGGRYTLFLPTDSAIRSMSPTLRSVTLADPRKLRKAVQYHISPGPLPDTVIDNELLIPSLLNQKYIRCNVYDMGNTVTVTGAPITAVIPSGNLTVALVNRTLIPPTGDVYLTGSKSPLLRNFTKLVKVANLEDELKNGGPYTLFAPSKCAFSRLPPDEYKELLTDPDKANAFVLRHVVRGTIYTTGVTDGMLLQAEDGTVLSLKTQTNCITVNGIKLKYGDISATNGVIHIIEKFL